MVIVPLKWLLFGLLLLLLVAVATAVWLDRRLRQKAIGKRAGLWAALEGAPFGVLVLEGDRTCPFVNPYARHLLGLPPPPCQLPETVWVQHLDEDRAAARLTMDIEGRYRSVSLPSERVVRWWVTSYDALDMVFLLDVTAQQRAEQAARFLLSDLSHELRTPLATILTHLEVLLLPDITEEIAQQSLRLLKAEAHRMVRLVNDVLDLGRLETTMELERRPVDLLTVVEEAVTQIAPQAEERAISLSLEADAPLPLVLGHADRLKQVFLNLLDNAIRYSRSGDRVVVSLRRVREGIACAVCDTGPGIPAQYLPHVARRFYRAVPAGVEGSGLGLALAKEILRLHQCKLSIESQAEGEETGTCVRFILPSLPEEEGKP